MQTKKTQLIELADKAVDALNMKNQGLADGKAITPALMLAYAMAIREEDTEAVKAVDFQNFKNKEAVGKYYGLRGSLSKARTVATSDMKITPESNISALYAEYQKARTTEVSERDLEKEAEKAFRALHHIDQKTWNSYTRSQRNLAIDEGFAIVENNKNQAPPEQTITVDADMIHQILTAFAQENGYDLMMEIVNQVPKTQEQKVA